MKAQTDMLDLQRLVWKSREDPVRTLLFAVKAKRAAKGVDEWKQTLKADPPVSYPLFCCCFAVWDEFDLTCLAVQEQRIEARGVWSEDKTSNLKKQMHSTEIRAGPVLTATSQRIVASRPDS